jgi:hypothetical protein
MRPRFPVPLDDATYEALRRRAFEERRSMAELTREAIGSLLRKPTRAPRTPE